MFRAWFAWPKGDFRLVTRKGFWLACADAPIREQSQRGRNLGRQLFVTGGHNSPCGASFASLP
ncbi:MAG: hypothetical protein ACTS5A_03800, partial [Candidatus Hodgkinia cicadicola]